MQIIRLFQIILALGLLTSCNVQQTNPPNIPASTEKEIDSIFEEYNDPNTPGVAIGIIQNGQMVFQKEYGSADLENKIPISKNSIFPLASVSKQFTVFAILLLEAEGKLSLDDDIRKYIPELNDFGKKISLRQLANHTSGMRSDLQLLGMSGISPNEVITMERVFQITLQQKELNFTPGEAFQYSNAGYVLMAEVVARVSGISFQEFTQSNVFRPLAMNHTFWMDDYKKVIEEKTSSYFFDGENFSKNIMNYEFYGSSGIWTTMEDFSKWAFNFQQTKVGSQTVFDKMKTLGILNNGRTTDYGLGQFVDKYNGIERIHHAGGAGAYRAFLGRFPAQGFTILLLSNNGNCYAQGKAMEVADLFLKSYLKKESADSAISEKLNFINLSLKQLQRFEGRYLHSKQYYTRELFVRNDSMIYSRGEQGGRESVLLPINENEFQMQGVGIDLRVVFKNKGTLLSIVEEGIETDILEKFVPKKYTSKTLEQFTGTFYSSELQTTYNLKIENKNLKVIHPSMQVILNPIKSDSFLGTSWQFQMLQFERDANNSIQGFRISSDRAKHVYFEKK